MTGIPQRLILRPMLFSVFIAHLDEGLECAYKKFTDDIKLGEQLIHLELELIFGVPSQK